MTPISGSTERPAEVEAKPLPARRGVMRRRERSRAGAGTGFEVMGFRGRGAAGLPPPEGEVETAKAVRVRSYGLTGGALLMRPPLLAETSGQGRECGTSSSSFHSRR